MKKYKDIDQRIVVINNDNNGVSFSRNLGIEISRGDYIFFCDSDDYIDKEVIQKLINIFENNDNVKICKILTKDKKMLYQKYLNNVNTFSIESHELINQILFGNFGGHTWGYLIKKELIKDIRFDVNIRLLEDTLFIIQLMLNVDVVYICNENYYYHHIVNNEGITGSSKYIFENILSLLKSINEIEKILISKKICVDKLDSKRMYLLEKEFSKCTEIKELKRILIDKEIYNHIFNIDSNNLSLFYKVYRKILINRNYNFILIYNILRKKMKYVVHLLTTD